MMLIVYYSFSNNTRILAGDIAKHTGGDIRELIPQTAYSFDYIAVPLEINYAKEAETADNSTFSDL